MTTASRQELDNHLDRLIERLANAGERPEPSLLEEIIAAGEAAVPALINLLEAVQDSEDWAPAQYVLQLLGSLRASAAVPAIMRFVRARDQEVRAFGDWIPETVKDTLDAIDDPDTVGDTLPLI